jgi:hypothetical protein
MTKNIVWSVIGLLLIIVGASGGVLLLVLIGGIFLIVNIVQIYRRNTKQNLLTQGKIQCPNCKNIISADNKECPHCTYTENCHICDHQDLEQILHCWKCNGQGIEPSARGWTGKRGATWEQRNARTKQR